MKNKLFRLLPVVCVLFVGVVFADQVNVTTETSFMSKYMWHGFEMYGDKSAASIDVNIDLGETGFYFGTEYITPNGSGNVNISDYDNYGYVEGSLTDRAKYIYYAGYMTSMFDEDLFKTDMDFRYQYHDYYRTSSDVLDQQELSLLAEWKNVLPYRLVPYYQAAYLSDGSGGNSIYKTAPSPAGLVYGDDQNADINGWLHKVGISVDLPFDMPEVGLMNVKLLAESVYNDGAFDTGDAAFDAGRSMGCGSEWTHITYGAQTDFELGLGQIGAGVYYQHALADDYANLNNTFYSIVSYKLDF